MANAVTTDTKVGKVVQVIGPVVDVEFEGGYLTPIYNALKISSDGSGEDTIDVIAEVEQHLGESRVRAVATKKNDTRRLVAHYQRRNSPTRYCC